MSAATRNQTSIVVDPNLPTVQIIREFDAPVADVWRAHTDPELYAQWIGPRSIDTKIENWDCRTGGSWRYVGSRDEDEFGFYGSFHEVRPEELIVQTFTYEGFRDGVSLETLAFEDLGGGRCRLTALSLVDTIEGRDAFVASGMESGVIEGYEQLDELLEKMS